jgi:hypothetical protein
MPVGDVIHQFRLLRIEGKEQGSWASSISSWGKKRQGSSPEDEPPGPHAEANFDLFALKSVVKSVIVSGRQSRLVGAGSRSCVF